MQQNNPASDASVPSELLGKPGSKTSDFKVLAVLGNGSYGICYKVQRCNKDVKTGKSHGAAEAPLEVLKAIPLAGLSERQRKATLNEAALMQRLHHPNIVTFIDSWCEQEYLYILMELCDRGSLLQVLADRRGVGLPEADIWKCLAHVARGLAYLHSKQILHRDIKPCNILLHGDRAVLADLGLGYVMAGPNCVATAPVGTPLYQSPELCLGRAYNGKSDIWALGCTTYHLAAGHPPFIASLPILLGQKIIGRPPPLLPAGYSPALQSIVTAMLAKEPADRPSAAELLTLVPIAQCLQAADAEDAATELRSRCRDLEAMVLQAQGQRDAFSADPVPEITFRDRTRSGHGDGSRPPTPLQQPTPSAPRPAPDSPSQASPQGPEDAASLDADPESPASCQCQELQDKCEALLEEAQTHRLEMADMQALRVRQEQRCNRRQTEIAQLLAALREVTTTNKHLEARLKLQELRMPHQPAT